MRTEPAADPSPQPATSARREIAGDIVAAAVVLGLLYVGREVLVPITLAIILSLVLLPLVRGLKRCGLGQTSAVLASVSALVIVVAGLATVIGVQMVHVAASLPQYEETIQAKVKALRELSVDRMAAVQNEAGRMFGGLDGQPRDVPGARGGVARGAGTAAAPLRVELQEPPESPQKVIARFFTSVWGPLETAGITLVVLVFVLIEHEPLRDRFIRLAGSADLRATTTAINDAGERLSRYFAAQFAVNFGVGAVIWLGLIALGFPQATLWATLTAVLRFVPYVGTTLAALSAALFAAAVVPGWDLMLLTMALYLVVETIASQAVEPLFFGHTTGLSPLAVVVGAIFWTWLWGPVGLVVSTPLTLCLLVTGRHVKALAILDILLGDAPALTMPERFYQRALSGDADEIIAAARAFLKRKTFAAYCDTVLLRAMQLADHDVKAAILGPEEQIKVRSAILTVIETLDRETARRPRKRWRNPVLEDANLGLHLRHRREAVSGRWQGPLAVPVGSVVLGVGLGSPGDDFATEILVRVLRDLGIDARGISIDELRQPLPAGSEPASVAIVYIVGVASDPALERYEQSAAKVRQRFPEAPIAAVLLPGLPSDVEQELPGSSEFDQVVRSFEQAAEIASARIPRGLPKPTQG
ncbi:MAG TPA: AI-2E family transporter [Rhodocyclaceae bacterium]